MPLVCGVERCEACLSEGGWDDDAVLVDSYVVDWVEVLAVIVKHSDVRGHLESGFWEAIFDRFKEHGHGRVRGAAVWASSQITTDAASREEFRDSCSRVPESSMSWLTCDKMSCGPVSTRYGISICGCSWCDMGLMSSMRCSLSSKGSPVRWRERVSGYLFFTPGTCTIENL